MIVLVVAGWVLVAVGLVVFFLVLVDTFLRGHRLDSRGRPM